MIYFNVGITDLVIFEQNASFCEVSSDAEAEANVKAEVSIAVYDCMYNSLV